MTRADAADILIEPADPGWIVVPGPELVDESPSAWAADAAERHLPRDRGARAWLAEVLERIVRTTGDDEVHALLVPDPRSRDVLLVRIRYAFSAGDRDATLRDLVLSGDGVLRDPVEPEPYPSARLGVGLRTVATRETDDGPMLVRAYAFRHGPYDLRISAADHEADRIERLGPAVDDLVDSIRLDPDPESDAPVAPPVEREPSDAPLDASAEDVWFAIPDELAALDPLPLARRARKLAGRLLPKRALGVLEPVGLDETTVLLGALAQLSRPGERWFVLRRTLPDAVIARVRWYRLDHPTTDDLVAATRAEPRSRARVGEARAVRGPDGSAAQAADWADRESTGTTLAFARDGHLVQARLEWPTRTRPEAFGDLERLAATIRIGPGR